MVDLDGWISTRRAHLFDTMRKLKAEGLLHEALMLEISGKLNMLDEVAAFVALSQEQMVSGVGSKLVRDAENVGSTNDNQDELGI